MRKEMLAALAAILGLTGPALGGELACLQDVRRIVHYVRGDFGAPGVHLTQEQKDKLYVAIAQCSFAEGQANANIVSLRRELGMRNPGPQTAFDPLFMDDPHAFD